MVCSILKEHSGKERKVLILIIIMKIILYYGEISISKHPATL